MSEPVVSPEGAAKPAEDRAGGGFFSETKEFLKAVAWAIAIAVLLRSFVVEAYKIPSGSMLPTLQVGDHIFVNKFIYGFMVPGTTTKFFMWREPKRGEVIVFKFPREIGKDYIKRVIGEPGDVVEVRGEELYVNGVLMSADHIEQTTVVGEDCHPRTARRFVEHLDTGVDHSKVHGDQTFGGYGPFTVPEGELFVLGDNRDNSSDSRTGFTVPMSYVKGRAMFVWLSWNHCGEWWPFEKIRFDRIGEGVR